VRANPGKPFPTRKLRTPADELPGM
jgi:hypothetical protein